VLIMGIILYFLSDDTATYFAWTIDVPLTAAFLGAGYLASFLLEFMAARQFIWARGRIAVPAVLLFTSLTFIITLIHLDKFHTNSNNPLTLIVTWAWILVYAFVPLIMGVILIQQLRTQGVNPASHAMLPLWFRLILGIQGAIMVILGLGFLFMPQTFAPLWAWELTPLTGRAIGAWLVGLGVAAIQSVIENDWLRLRPAMIAYMLYGFLQGINLLRYPNATGLDWGQPKTWVYCIFILSILLVGIFGTWQAQRQKAG
ncbi:MAG TPA: hypothetical protein PLZ51_28950, partial [Aggregatilineales bacterium]|nr:hypothetical protein [Aggregatilineales bacterium]